MDYGFLFYFKYFMRITWKVFADPCVCLDKPFRNDRVMRLMQDGASSYTAYTPLKLLQAH